MRGVGFKNFRQIGSVIVFSRTRRFNCINSFPEINLPEHCKLVSAFSF